MYEFEWRLTQKTEEKKRSDESSSVQSVFLIATVATSFLQSSRLRRMKIMFSIWIEEMKQALVRHSRTPLPANSYFNVLPCHLHREHNINKSNPLHVIFPIFWFHPQMNGEREMKCQPPAYAERRKKKTSTQTCRIYSIFSLVSLPVKDAKATKKSLICEFSFTKRPKT